MILTDILQRIQGKKKNTIIRRGVSMSKSTIYEGFNTINSGSYIDTFIGFGTTFSGNCELNNAYIGKYCSIGKNVRIVYGNHPIQNISTNAKLCYENYCNILATKKGYTCEIGNDVWIGDNVLIKGGVTIGNGAVIGFGSIVTKDVEPYAVVGGNPARFIKYRFSEDVRQKLDVSRWWEIDYFILKDVMRKAKSIEEFLTLLNIK